MELRSRVLVYQSQDRVMGAALMTGFRRAIAKCPGRVRPDCPKRRWPVWSAAAQKRAGRFPPQAALQTEILVNFAQLPATARSNQVATVYAVQDVAQREALTSRQESEMILTNLGTQIWGRTTNTATAERVSKIFVRWTGNIGPYRWA